MGRFWCTESKHDRCDASFPFSTWGGGAVEVLDCSESAPWHFSGRILKWVPFCKNQLKQAVRSSRIWSTLRDSLLRINLRVAKPFAERQVPLKAGSSDCAKPPSLVL